MSHAEAVALAVPTAGRRARTSPDDASCARRLPGSTHVSSQLFATFGASSPWWNPASHRERRGARVARRDEGPYWAYSTEEQRSPRGTHRRSNAAGLSPRAASGRRPARSRRLVRAGRGRTGSGDAPHAHRLARGDHADGRRDRPHPRHRARRRGERGRGRDPLSPPVRAVLEPGGTYLGIQHLQGIARRPRLDRPPGRVRRAGARGGQSARPAAGRFGCWRLSAAARSAHHTSAAAGVDRAERPGPLLCRDRGDARGHAAR